ncbi:hypothetical protein [Georgenia deserti]|uniref:Uncharacterized protein n=1 Tax=Georgenia deserti TaxID=2093781 RepID=A0ABW4L4Q6_9MICO
MASAFGEKDPDLIAAFRYLQIGDAGLDPGFAAIGGAEKVRAQIVTAGPPTQDPPTVR